MNCNDRLQLNTSKIVHETVDGEVIIINMENGNYYSLNNVGADIWTLIEKNFTITDIVDEIVVQYQGNTEQIKEDIAELIADLKQEELIVTNGGETSEDFKASNNKPKSDANKDQSHFEKPILHKYTDMQEMLLLDPIHEVDETGWPTSKAISKQND